MPVHLFILCGYLLAMTADFSYCNRPYGLVNQMFTLALYRKCLLTPGLLGGWGPWTRLGGRPSKKVISGVKMLQRKKSQSQDRSRRLGRRGASNEVTSALSLGSMRRHQLCRYLGKEHSRRGTTTKAAEPDYASRPSQSPAENGRLSQGGTMGSVKRTSRGPR